MPDGKTILKSIKIKHLIVFTLFLIALAMRGMAAGRLEITQPEADILIDLTRDQTAVTGQASILYQILTIPLMNVFGAANWAARFWPVLAGCVMVLLPLLFEDLLGRKTVILFSVFIAFDPFLTANSIQINGSALTLCALVLAIGFMRKNKYLAAIISIVGFLLSGPAIVYALLLGIYTLASTRIRKGPSRSGQFVQDSWKYCRENIPVIGAILFTLASIIYLCGIQISDLVGNIQFFFQEWGQPYSLGNAPLLYPIALVSYLPFGIILLFFSRPKENKTFALLPIFIWIITSLFFVSLNPGHQVLDLVWVSLPVWLIGAVNLDGLITRILESQKKTWIYILIFTCLMISLTLTGIMLVYQFNYGLSVVSGLLSTISLLILITMAFILLAYSEAVPLAITTLRIATAVVFMVIQIAFAWRSLGLNGKPAGEILWGGYYEGRVVVRTIIDNSDLTALKTGLENKVVFLDYANSAVKWGVGQDYPAEDQPLSLGNVNYAVVITSANDALADNHKAGYYGQKFVADSYPLWTWQPLKSLLDSDYWFWLIFRQGQMYRDFNYIWVNRSVFTSS